jgi:hypothetical protein
MSKHRGVVLGCTFFLSLLLSCGLFDQGDEGGANSIGGSTDIALGQVGNEFTPGSITIGATSYPISASMKILSNADGMVTMQVTADTANISNIPALKQLYDAVPDDLKDATGKISTQLKFKMTSEGMLDYVNMDEKPHTLVKYDCKPGDSYSVSKSSGKTLTRTVLSKSTTDDFPYGFFYIKTIEIEQPMSFPGIRKFKYRANHKFGIVWVEAELEDGSKASSYIYSKY